MDVEGLCRTCVYSDAAKFSLFEGPAALISSETTTIVDFLQKFTNISFAPNDGLPSEICTICIDEINRAHTFKLKCESSDINLKKLKVLPIKIENDEQHNYQHQNDEPLESKIKVEITGHDNSNLQQADNILAECRAPEQAIVIEEMPKVITSHPDSNEICDSLLMQEFVKEESVEYEMTDCQENDSDENKYESEDDAEDQCTKEIYTCAACPHSQTFKRISMLRNHIVGKHTEGQMCKLCVKVIHFDMWKHCMQHLPKKYKCSECDRGFIRQQFLTSHMRIHSREKKFKCTECTDVFATYYDLKKHVLMHNERNAGLQRLEQLKKDLQKQSEIPTYSCDLCPKVFLGRTAMIDHRTLHTGEKRYECEICHKCFRQKSCLMTHLNGHTNERKNLCPICPAILKRKNNLNQHLIKMHSPRIGLDYYPCDNCTRRFETADELEQHTSIEHPNQDNFFCGICSKVFREKRYLDSHRMIHTGARPFKCDICDRSFNRKPTLNVHMRSHYESQVHQCKLCAANFKHKTTLTKHVKKVHDKIIVSLECDVCLKLFDDKHLLESHKVTHTGERRFECEICLKRFRQRSTLNNHRLTHSEDRPHKCPKCSFHFKRRSVMMKHARAVHFLFQNSMDNSTNSSSETSTSHFGDSLMIQLQ